MQGALRYLCWLLGFCVVVHGEGGAKDVAAKGHGRESGPARGAGSGLAARFSFLDGNCGEPCVIQDIATELSC